ADAAISVVLPVYSAATDLQPNLQRWATTLDSLARDYEILLVNAGTDPIGPQAESLTGQLPRLRVLPHLTPGGRGGALRAGLAAGHLPLFCYAECSTAYEPADLAKMLDLIDHVDLVSGYREGKAHRRHEGLLTVLFRWMLRWVLGVHLKDAECSFKLFR